MPAVVDPDAWLPLVAGRRYLRTVRPAGSIVVEHARYYVWRRLAGQRVTAAVSAADRALVVRHRDTVVKRAPLHGLRLELLPFERYVELMCQEARSERRRRAGTAAAGRVAWPCGRRGPDVGEPLRVPMSPSRTNWITAPERTTVTSAQS